MTHHTSPRQSHPLLPARRHRLARTLLVSRLLAPCGGSAARVRTCVRAGAHFVAPHSPHPFPSGKRRERGLPPFGAAASPARLLRTPLVKSGYMRAAAARRRPRLPPTSCGSSSSSSLRRLLPSLAVGLAFRGAAGATQLAFGPGQSLALTDGGEYASPAGGCNATVLLVGGGGGAGTVAGGAATPSFGGSGAAIVVTFVLNGTMTVAVGGGGKSPASPNLGTFGGGAGGGASALFLVNASGAKVPWAVAAGGGGSCSGGNCLGGDGGSPGGCGGWSKGGKPAYGACASAPGCPGSVSTTTPMVPPQCGSQTSGGNGGKYGDATLAFPLVVRGGASAYAPGGISGGAARAAGDGRQRARALLLSPSPPLPLSPPSTQTPQLMQRSSKVELAAAAGGAAAAAPKVLARPTPAAAAAPRTWRRACLGRMRWRRSALELARVQPTAAARRAGQAWPLCCRARRSACFPWALWA